MQRLNKLIEKTPYESNIVTDPKHIEYLIGHYYDCGERVLALLVFKNKKPILILNSLFKAPNDIKVISYHDSDDVINIIQNELTGKVIGIDGNWPTRFSIQFINNYEIHDISPMLERIRSIKDENEIKLLKEASLLNDEVMKKVKNFIKPGITEKELSEKIRVWQSIAPLSGISFEPIVLFSENAADPHGIPQERILKDDDLVLIDMGGMYKGYASDMTRCYLMPNHTQLIDIYNIIQKANEESIKAIKPGVTFAQIDKIARDIITEAGYGPNFVHRLGHGVGMEVHEPLDVSAANNTVLEKGMCFSIEPGIYIEGVGGVRIEDLVCVTEDGVMVLNELSKNIEFI